MHEWVETFERSLTTTEKTTWVFDADSFVPSAKLVGDKSYSIVSDYLGTPCQAYSENGAKVWEYEQKSYGGVESLQGAINFIPFRYQGQYEDVETGLYYNRFRYYSPDEGSYISQDPIGLFGGMEFYGYVKDCNAWVDVFGLNGQVSFIGDALHPKTVSPSNPGGVYTITATGSYHGDKKALYGEAKLKEGFSSDYVAHHISYDSKTNTMQMQLVKKDAHKISHEGGAKDYRAANNGEGYEQPKKKTKH